jgi:hypothetical protein
MRKHIACLSLLLAGIACSSLAQQTEAKPDTTRGATSLQIKIIKGGPCGDASQRIAQSALLQDHSIQLDMACSCLRTRQEYLSEDF